MYYQLYTLLGWLLVLAAVPFFAPYCLLTRRHLDGLWQRLGFIIPVHAWQHSTRIWFHAASVGEVQVAKSLIAALSKKGIKADFIITTVTEQGYLAAQKHFSGLALCLYAPLDIPWIVNRFITRLKPVCYICLETELWPNTLRLMRANGVTTLLMNGRLSARSFRRYQKLPGFVRQVVGCFDAVSVIHDIDRTRYQALGIAPDKIQITGNAKYDLSLESLTMDKAGSGQSSNDTLRDSIIRHYRDLLGLQPDQPVLLAGSTHSGEERMILEAFKTLSVTIPDLALIVAPRHLERLDQITAEWHSQKISFTRLTQARDTPHRERIILVDLMGELAGMYSVATYVFCGGSLVDRGGHNIMEPALWAKPPMYGPFMSDFSEACAMLENREAGFLVNNTEELIVKIMYFLQHQENYQQAGRRALAVAEAQQGAAARQVKMICQALGT